jgi:hypothetical protein
MNNWPTEHRAALAIFLVLITGMVAVFFFVVRPKAVAVGDLQSGCDSLVQSLKKETKETQYPLDAGQLEAMLKRVKARLDGRTVKRADGTEHNTGLISQSKEVLAQATSMFDAGIKKEYTDVYTFMNQVSRIIYRDELNHLEESLKNKQIVLDEEVLGIGEDTDTEETYQLLLKLWTIEKLVNVLVDNHHLTIQARRLAAKDDKPPVRTPFGFMGGRFASEITVLPTKAYILHEDDAEPYILEFPVRVRFSGDLPTVCQAIRDLQSDGNFMTVNRFVLEAEDPLTTSRRSPGSDGILRSKNVTVMLEVSSYFRPSGHAPSIRRDNSKTLPPGA